MAIKTDYAVPTAHARIEQEIIKISSPGEQLARVMGMLELALNCHLISYTAVMQYSQQARQKAYGLKPVLAYEQQAHAENLQADAMFADLFISTSNESGACHA